jgi:hypothetical protein
MKCKQKEFIIYTTNLEKTMPIRYRKAPGHQTDLTKIELTHDILSLKQQAQRIETKY